MSRTLTALLVTAAVTATACVGGPISLKLGTGSEAGVYLTVGQALAELVNAGSDRHRFAITVSTSKGSVANVQGLQADAVDLAMVQADIQADARAGRGPWLGSPVPDLRSLMALYTEAVTLVASDSSGITTLADLAGKRVNLGPEGSGTHSNAQQVLSAAGLLESDLQATKSGIDESKTSFLAGELDAFFFTVGHPSDLVSSAVSGAVPAHFVPIDSAVDSLVQGGDGLSRTSIAIGHYPEATNASDVVTYGVKAVLTCLDTLDDAAADAIVATALEDLAQLHAAVAVLKALDAASMQAELGAPLHDGAQESYAR